VQDLDRQRRRSLNVGQVGDVASGFHHVERQDHAARIAGLTPRRVIDRVAGGGLVAAQDLGQRTRGPGQHRLLADAMLG
jgi:hypothetical protein